MATAEFTDAQEAAEAEIRERLRWEMPLFGPNCLTIVDKLGRVLPYEPKPEQVRFHRTIQEAREQGKAPRILVLKARQVGISTATQAEGIQQTTQRPNQRGLVLAHDNRTAGPLFDIGQRMWDSIPDELDLKPKVIGRRKTRLLEFSNGSRYESDTAREFESGRGLTLRFLHLSEIAFYPDAERKLTGLLQAVPDDPWTLVVGESSANGQNYFKKLWDSAVAGESDWITFFSPWFEEPSYRQGFANDQELEDFIASIGEGEIGEREHELLDLGLDYEQLHWRRRLIRNNFGGDIDRFNQEHPTVPLDAFMTSGRHVFDIGGVRRVQAKVRELPSPQTGTLVAKGPLKERVSRGVTVHYPTAVEFQAGPINDDRRPGWTIFEHPRLKTTDEDGKSVPGGQYVMAVDASGGDEIEGTGAYHVIDIIDHQSRAQVAEYRSRIDPDELALEILKGALFYGTGTGGLPWVAIEITGGWGLPAVKRLHMDFKYALTYRRRRQTSAKESYEDTLGWHTGFGEKKMIVAELKEILKEPDPGVRSRGLASEFGTYILDDRNRQKPEHGHTADRLIAHGIACCVAREKPLRPDRKRGETHSTVPGGFSTTGYLR